jgi:hypothetical protein
VMTVVTMVTVVTVSCDSGDSGDSGDMTVVRAVVVQLPLYCTTLAVALSVPLQCHHRCDSASGDSGHGRQLKVCEVTVVTVVTVDTGDS